jgi:hypothetical protein
MMTLQEFRATAQRVAPDEAAEAIGMFAEDFGDDAVAVWLYDETLFIVERDNGTFWTLIGRDECEGSQETVSNALFHDWYVSEMVDPAEVSTEWLSGILGTWSAWRGLDVASADEMLFDHLQEAPAGRDPWTRANIAWLEWFIVTWERVQMREDGEGFGNRA